MSPGDPFAFKKINCPQREAVLKKQGSIFYKSIQIDGGTREEKDNKQK